MGQGGMSFGTQYHHEAPSNLQVEHVECVLLLISYHLYFLCISKVFGSYITGQWGKFTVKNATLYVFTYIFQTFFFCFSSKKKRKKKVFLSFPILFSDEVSNFHNRLLTNQKPEQVTRNCQYNYMCNSAVINIR